MKKRNRILSLVLVLLLCLGLCAPAFADGDMGKVGERSIISAGRMHTAAVDENGALWTWGDNGSGELGNGTTENSKVPVKVLDGVASVSCWYGHTAAIKSDGSLWTWGSNLGNGTTEHSLVPVKVMDDVAAVSYGAAIKADGSLWTWGGNLGNGTIEYSRVPVKVMDDVAAVSCGGGHTAAIKTDSSLWTWGGNTFGQLGNGGQWNVSYDHNNPIQTIPVKVLDDVVAVSCGNCHTAAIKTDGSLWMWGQGGQGQFGNGTAEVSFVPFKVMDDVAAVSCGGDHTAAIKTDGSLWMWGDNYYGEVGNGTTEGSLVPVKVLDNVAAVSCAVYHTIAVKTDGTLWTWGENHFGQLGNGGTGNATYMSNPIQTVPAQITLDGASMPRGVRLNLNGGTGGGTLWTSPDGAITVPTNPTRPGYTFGGWYTDAALTIPWNFNDKVVNVLVLYAKWTPVSSTAATTAKSTQTVSLNGRTVAFDAYTLIADNGGDVTYVKLRDVAALLEDTDARFNVDWRNRAIYVSSGSAYTTKNGTELKPISGTDGSYEWNTAPVLFDGVTKALEGIVLTDGDGGGHTFFKLRDLGEAIGFTVGWTAERGIFIETE